VTAGYHVVDVHDETKIQHEAITALARSPEIVINSMKKIASISMVMI